MPQRNRPWLVPPGQEIHWGAHNILNTGPQGHKLQWFKGILYCTQCGGWTAQSGRPKKLVAPCSGRGQRAPRILKAVADNRIPAFMRPQEWPAPHNRP
eukprot:9755266-Karenia_brevis.AAC.1